MSTMNYLTGIVLEKLAKRAEFFQNSKLQSMVHVIDDEYQQDWPVRSERVIDLLSEIYSDASMGEILQKRPQEFLLRLIRERCRRGKRRFSECEAEDAEANPIVQAVLCFVNEHERFEGRLVDLLEILRDSEIAESFPQREGIPKFTRVFSERLRRLIPVLNGYGVDVSIEHREDGSYCLIVRTEAFVVEAEINLEQDCDPDAVETCVSLASGVSTGNE